MESEAASPEEAVAATAHAVQRELLHAPQHRALKPAQGILKGGKKKKKGHLTSA